MGVPGRNAPALGFPLFSRYGVKKNMRNICDIRLQISCTVRYERNRSRRGHNQRRLPTLPPTSCGHARGSYAPTNATSKLRNRLMTDLCSGCVGIFGDSARSFLTRPAMYWRAHTHALLLKRVSKTIDCCLWPRARSESDSRSKIRWPPKHYAVSLNPKTRRETPHKQREVTQQVTGWSEIQKIVNKKEKKKKKNPQR